MENEGIERILENLSAVVPVFHRKLLRMDLGGVTGTLTRLHMGIMGTLQEGSMTVSDLARVSIVPKSQMTHLIDQLVEAEIVERHPDSQDRRKIYIALTEKGRIVLDDLKRKVEESTRKELAVLTPDEITEMSRALETLKRIVARI